MRFKPNNIPHIIFVLFLDKKCNQIFTLCSGKLHLLIRIITRIKKVWTLIVLKNNVSKYFITFITFNVITFINKYIFQLYSSYLMILKISLGICYSTERVMYARNRQPGAKPAVVGGKPITEELAAVSFKPTLKLSRL